jgi:adenine-specific DNA-methyltransferase
LVRDIISDITYIDPPYNARQYVNFYHVLENLALWQKPEELE